MNFWLIFMVLAFRNTATVKSTSPNGVPVKLARTVVVIHPANDEERFQRSIFHALVERGGQFSSRMQIYLHDVYHRNHRTTVVVGQSESYSFKSKLGTYQMDEYGKPFTALYTSGKEVHNFGGNSSDCLRGEVDEHKFCDSRLFKSEFQHHLVRWLPMQIFDRHSDYDLLGLNVLLELFYKTFRRDKDRMKCESSNLEDSELYDWAIKMFPRKCSISFDDAVRLDYRFVSNENHTDYPTKIELHQRHLGEWKMTKQFKYTAFRPTFGEEPIVDSSLPIGHGCRRLDTASYPKIETDYGSRFELELDILFDYSQAPGAEDDHYDGSSGMPNRTVRTYAVRLVVDEVSSINMAETIDEITNASVRTYYVQKSHLLYSLAGGQCSIYNLTSNRSLNWFYVQEMLARRPELFYATPNYSFLREFSLDGVRCLVFEETIDYRVWASEEYRAWKEGKKSDRAVSLTEDLAANLAARSTQNSTEKPATARPRKNQVPTENNQVMATHYYPKDAAHWPDNPNRLSIPKRIELTIFGRFHSIAYSRMVIDIRSFKSNPSEIEKYYLSESTRCDLKDKSS